MSRTFAATAFASGLAVTLTAAALADGPYLKIGDIKGESTDSKHKGEIEIESWSWGATQSSGMGSHAGGGGGGAGKANIAAGAAPASKVESPMLKQGVAEAKKKGNVEYSWKVEEGEKAPQAPGEAEITLKAEAAPDSAARKLPGRLKTADVTLKRGMAGSAAGGVNVASGDVDGDGRAELAGPLTKGSLRVKVKMPWPACRVGTRYPSLELGDGTRAYRLTDAVVTSCGTTDGSVPTEQISFNYAKVEVRGWNPEKKEE